MQNRMLLAASTCFLGTALWLSPAKAAQMSVVSFPDKLIISATDNRIIAFVAAKDGTRLPNATIQVTLSGIGGKLNRNSCQTDDSGKCLFSYTAPQELGEGKIEAVASMSGAKEGKTSVDIKIVPVPNTKDSGWQCDDDNAVFAQINQKISCSTACSLEKGCAGSPCAAGSGAYCHSAEEACACNGTNPDAQGRTKAATTAPAANSDADPNNWHYSNPLAGTVESLSEAGVKFIQAILGLIGTIALLLLIIAGVVYITAAGNEEKIKQAKKIVTGTIIGLGIALIAYSLLITLSEIMQVKNP